MNISGVKDKNGTSYGLDPAQHLHSESEGWLSTIVNRLQTAINGKAASTHTQAISTITGLQTALDGKAAKNEIVSLDEDETAKVHVHTNGDIELKGIGVTGTAVDSTPTANSTKIVTSGGVSAALAGKSDDGHTHDGADVTTHIDGASINLNTAIQNLKNWLNHKADKVALSTTMDVDAEGNITFSNLDDKTEGQVCLIEVTMFSGASKQGGLLIVQKFATIYSQAIIAGYDIYARAYISGHWNEWEHRVVPVEGAPIEISGVTGLQTALDGKLSGNVNVVLVNQSTTKNVRDMVGDGLFLFVGGTKKLNQIIVGNVGDTILYHQNSGESQSISMMCRAYHWESPDGINFYFIEVVGLWDV